eukprot:5142864-Amphidinium_carterae.1
MRNAGATVVELVRSYFQGILIADKGTSILAKHWMYFGFLRNRGFPLVFKALHFLQHIFEVPDLKVVTCSRK